MQSVVKLYYAICHPFGYSETVLCYMPPIWLQWNCTMLYAIHLVTVKLYYAICHPFGYSETVLCYVYTTHLVTVKLYYAICHPLVYSETVLCYMPPIGLQWNCTMLYAIHLVTVKLYYAICHPFGYSETVLCYMPPIWLQWNCTMLYATHWLSNLWLLLALLWRCVSGLHFSVIASISGNGVGGLHHSRLPPTLSVPRYEFGWHGTPI